MTILQFDKYGKFVRSFNSVNEAKEKTGAKNIIRCLLREAPQTCGSIFAFENDERIDENGNLKVLDYIVQYDVSGTLEIGRYTTIEECPNPERTSPRYSTLDKKFDTKPRKIECWYKERLVGVFDNVGEARRITGSPCIWANLFEECKTTNGLFFKFAV